MITVYPEYSMITKPRSTDLFKFLALFSGKCIIFKILNFRAIRYMRFQCFAADFIRRYK